MPSVGLQFLATAEEKAKEGDAYKRYGLRPLEPLLENIDLIDAAYLIALGEAGGVVPRGQDVPAAARINAASVWRLRRREGLPRPCWLPGRYSRCSHRMSKTASCRRLPTRWLHVRRGS